MEEVAKPEVFPKEIKLTPCSYNVGTCGHEWPTALAVVKCGGCQSFVLMSRQENCPYCNEPIEKIVVRNDHIARGGGVAKRCQGEGVYGETHNIELTKERWREIEEDTRNEKGGKKDN